MIDRFRTQCARMGADSSGGKGGVVSVNVGLAGDHFSGSHTSIVAHTRTIKMGKLIVANADVRRDVTTRRLTRR